MGEENKKNISLTVTEACNLQCVYCYENCKSKHQMSFDVAKRIIDAEFMEEDGFDEITLDFFGGEPFLNYELIKSISEYIWSKEWPKRYILFATTNGTLIHGGIKDWLKQHKDKFILGLSLDGTREMHNLNRSNSFDSIDIDFFQQLWPEQGVKMTISTGTLSDLAAGCIYLHEKGFRINNNFAHGIDWNSPHILGMAKQQLKLLADYYITHYEQEECMLLNRDISQIVYFRHYRKWCGAGTHLRAYSIKGERYPCYFFQPLALGEKSASLMQNIDFSNLEILMDPDCKGCILLSMCPTCYGSNYATTGCISKKDTNLCSLTKLTALAASYMQYNKLIRYTNEDLKIDDCRRKELTDAIILIQAAFGDLAQ